MKNCSKSVRPRLRLRARIGGNVKFVMNCFKATLSTGHTSRASTMETPTSATSASTSTTTKTTWSPTCTTATRLGTEDALQMIGSVCEKTCHRSSAKASSELRVMVEMTPLHTCSSSKFQPSKAMTVENKGILAITRSSAIICK